MTSWREAAAMFNEKARGFQPSVSADIIPFGKVASIALPDIKSDVISSYFVAGVKMADGSAIEWTDATWNPVTGCTKISAGCDNCYAARFSERFRGVQGHPFEMGFDLTLKVDRLQQPFGWKRPRMIFVNSMSDLFHKQIPRSYVEAVFCGLPSGGSNSMIDRYMAKWTIA
jgi:hypothetical protein